jgi:monoamine oxidase
VAGIAAARALADGGSTVVVLEASASIGGRAATDRSLGGPVHTGAAWLHGDVGNPIATAARRVGVALTPSRWQRTETFVLGTGSLDSQANARVGSIRARVDVAVERAQRIASIDETAGPVLRRLLDESGTTGIERMVLDRWVVGIYESLYAAPVDDLSLVHAEEPFRLPGDDLTLLGGLDTILADLVDGLDVRVDHRVQRIARDTAGWRVEGAASSLRADAVVVTIPVGALKAGRITFEPPLAARVVDALGRIGAGVVTKAFFTFDEDVWAPRWSFSTVADPRPPFELWVDTSELTGQPTLGAFVPASRAREIEALDESALCALAEQTLRDARIPLL